MANLTITVPDEVLLRARVRAVENGTSVNAVLRDELERFAGQTQAEAVEAFIELVGELPARLGEPYVWDRDEIYEERMEKASPTR